MFSKFFAVTVLATAASAHMKITSPVPFNNAALNNSPLEADGSNFPCKVGTVNGVTYDLIRDASNVYAQGSTQKLAFLGSVVHGGGSCQISVTTDAQPDKNSVWKVIKSIEGGCPAKDQTGNMGEDANFVDPYTYDYTIPKELQAGNYTLAWTWFNKVGNREMYMNCAPLTVTGSGGSKDFLSTLPDMFTANIGGKCTTPDNTDLQFPNPGKDLDRFNSATPSALATPLCGSGSGSGSAPSGSPAQPTQASVPSAGGVFITSPPASQPAATQPAASQPAASQPAASEPVVTSAPVASPPAQSQAAPSPTSSAAAAAALPPAPSSGSNASAGSSPSGGFAAGTACPTEGQWNCIDGTHFQRCASGSWSASQAVADGTSCQSGQAESLKMVAKRGKKSMRRAVRMRA